MARARVARGGAAAVGCLTLLSLALALPATAADETVAPDVVATATDGPSSEPWLATEVGDVRAVASGVAPFVAVGSIGYPPTAAAWSSEDGLEWTPASVVDAAVGTTLTAVVPVEDGLVALGHESRADGGETDRVVAWRSADAITWEPASIERPAKGGLQAVVADVASGPTGALALGSFIGQDIGQQRLWHSLDGRTWTPVPLPGAKRSIWSSLAELPDGYLLMGQSSRGRVSNWRSSDGRTWARVKDSPRLFDLASPPEGVSVGIGAKAIWLSPDLRSWDKVWTRPRSWDVGGSNAFEWVDWDGSEYLVVGRDLGSCEPNTDECQRNPLLVSNDGRTWVELPGPDGEPGADPATWLEDSTSAGGATIIEGRSGGSDVVWLIEGALGGTTTTD